MKLLNSVIFISLIFLYSCADPIQLAKESRETNGEIFTVLGYTTFGLIDKVIDNWVGLGIDKFHQGEGMIVVDPIEKQLVYFQIINENNQVVYSESYDQNDCSVSTGYTKIFDIGKLSLQNGKYTAIAELRKSNRTIRKNFWILGKPSERYNDKFYISSFQDIKAGSYPKKRDSFNKSEVPEVIIIGNKGKVVNIKVYSISSTNKVLDYSRYISGQNVNTYIDIPLENLTPDSYKVQCIIDGIAVKTLFFSISN